MSIKSHKLYLADRAIYKPFTDYGSELGFKNLGAPMSAATEIPSGVAPFLS